MVPGEASPAVVMALAEELQLLGLDPCVVVLQVCFPCPGWTGWDSWDGSGRESSHLPAWRDEQSVL